ncbi:MAG: M15 family metallopeptidase [Clostridiales bacterium]|nr:M15 family metallopeptidase [Clostridiales bacterium]
MKPKKKQSINPKYLIAAAVAAILFIALLIFLILHLNQPSDTLAPSSLDSSVAESLASSDESVSESGQGSLGVSSDTADSSEVPQSSSVLSSSSGSSDPSSSAPVSSSASSSGGSTGTSSDSSGDILAGKNVNSLPWNLSIANKWHSLTDSRIADTQVVYTIPNCEYGVDARARDSLVAMVNDANAAGCGLWYSSIYRSVDSQRQNFENRVQMSMSQAGGDRTKAEEIAASVVARPGTSDHNLGLAVDFNGCKTAFKDTAAYRWLIEHCADYGYVLRYPADKVDITKVVYEPWHYRYVGKEHAKIIMEKKITLEEYLRDYIL